MADPRILSEKEMKWLRERVERDHILGSDMAELLDHIDALQEENESLRAQLEDMETEDRYPLVYVSGVPDFRTLHPTAGTRGSDRPGDE